MTIIAIGVLSYIHFTPLQAANLRSFNPGNIMSDFVMSNKNSMSVSDIQAFLESKNACNNTNIHLAQRYPHLQFHIRNGKFVCMAHDTFNGETAAQIIWQTAQDYTINPQVLIVLLEKEQSLITDTWPNHIQYRSATGFGCPDTAECDKQHYGLKNQVRRAAKLFREVLDGGWTNYPLGKNYVRYHPNASCGGTEVIIENLATSALYRYTPYQPNQAALNAGYGRGDGCSAYGNRNFYALFTDWFGSTSSGVYIDTASATKQINEAYFNNRTTLGKKIGVITPEHRQYPRVWQNFENGTIVWTADHGAHIINYGSIYDRWRQLGGSLGTLGVPTSSQVTESDGRVWQNFTKGVVIYSKKTGAWEIPFGSIYNFWRQSGGSSGEYGKPIGAQITLSKKQSQRFENGTISL